jgi:hypothetical protein
MIEKHVIESLSKIFERDLNKLEEEIKSYPNEISLWEINGDIKNPAGNLCLHLCGNLQHYIGKVLGNSDYVRNRDFEFSARNIARKDIILEVQKTRHQVMSTLKSLNAGDLIKNYPERVFDYSMTILHFLVHLEAHLNYHLGQINYHRRLVAV